MRLLRRKGRFFEVPIQDLVLRVSGPEELYEEARAAGMTFWEQVQSYAIRNPGFRDSKGPIEVPEDVPGIIREMVEAALAAGVGPIYTFQGAVTQYVGRAVHRVQSEVVVSCDGEYFVVTRKRQRLEVKAADEQGRGGVAIVVKPELGPQGISSTMDRAGEDSPGGLVVVGRSCILAAAATTAATAILAKPGSFHAALEYLQGLGGVHGALILKDDQIGVAGGIELAA